MKIRLGTKKDCYQVAQYVKDLWMMHADKDPTFYNLEVFRTADPIKYYSSIDNKSSILLIADDNGKLAGFLKLDIKEIERFFLSKKILYADEIFVLKKYRKQGVAKLLMTKAENIARKKKIILMKARVYHFNDPAQKSLLSFGYKALYSEWFKVIQ